MSNIFFTADPHYGHFNIIRYCDEPFATVEEKNETQIARHNAVVKPNDIVYILGDFCFGDFWKYFPRLNGQKHLIKGNHDKEAWKHRREFASFAELRGIGVDGQDITLCHYPMRSWNKSHRGSWMLYGHHHGNLADDPHLLSFDVGVDCHNFYPISFEQVRDIMKTKLWQPIPGYDKARDDKGGMGLGKEDFARLMRYKQFEQLKKEFEAHAAAI